MDRLKELGNAWVPQAESVTIWPTWSDGAARMSYWKGKNKFGAKRSERMGMSFASAQEAALYEMLRLRELAGEISDLCAQVSVYLSEARILYKPDFSFIERGERAWAEQKGFETPSWRIKRRLWAFYGPGELRVYKGNPPTLAEVITPRGRS
jgi:hypothetical protein